MLLEWEPRNNPTDLGEAGKLWGFSSVFNVPGWVGVIEQAREWEKAERWGHGRLQPSVWMGIRGVGQPLGTSAHDSVNAEQWGLIPRQVSL